MKQPIKLFELWQETIDVLTHDGLLLCSVNSKGVSNVMTIGWMTGGEIWSKPIIIVLVRPSRWTYSRLAEVPEFTVNVLPPNLMDAVQYCGTASGRNGEKFTHTKLKPVAAQNVRAPIIEQGVVHYECRVLHKNDVVPGALVQAILDDAYAQGDFHRLYFGEIVAAYADEDAAQRLSKLAAGVLPVARP